MDRLIPFTPDVYVGMFAGYNETTWTAFTAAVALGLVTLICIRRGDRNAGRILALSVATFWIWTGWAFFIETYARLNWAAVPFGWLFIAQGVVTAIWGGVLGRFETSTGRTHSVEIGTALLFVALIGHPVLTYALGHPIETAHGFGTAPATVALIAVAALYLIYGRRVLWLAVWPVLWAAWDLASAWTMGLWRDVPLPALTLFFAAWLAAQRLRR